MPVVSHLTAKCTAQLHTCNTLVLTLYCNGLQSPCKHFVGGVISTMVTICPHLPALCPFSEIPTPICPFSEFVVLRNSVPIDSL